MPLKRRDFLKIAGGASLAWPLTRCSLGKMSDSVQQSTWFSALEEWVPTVCGACPGGCGVLVRKIDDRVVKLEGNPLHPLNKGKLCPKGQAGIQLLYGPTRVRSPLLKEGDRRSKRWREISWEEGLQTLSSKLLELRKAGNAHTVAFIGPAIGNYQDELVSRFLQVYGTPNFITFDPWKTLKLAYTQTQGVSSLLGYDFENTRYILSFGAQFLDNWPTSMEVQRAYGERRSRRNIKIVQIEPRFSHSASRADLWIPLNPGTEGYLALGLASVIIREQLYDLDFIQRFTSEFQGGNGSPPMASEFKKTILEGIRLEKVSSITGVPLRTIIEIAKEFASSRPAVAIADYNLSFRPNALMDALAIHSLNALAGSIDVPGGLVHQRKAPLKKMNEPRLDEMAKQGLSRPRIDRKSPDQAKRFLENGPYEINCLMLSPNSLPSDLASSQELENAIEKVPFVASFSPFLDETTELANLVLPDTTYFEKWQMAEVPSLSKTPAVGVGRPVVKPLDNARPFEDVLLSLAHQMGGAIASNFPWTSHKDVLFEQLTGLFEAKRGSVFPLPYEEVQIRTLEERGWWMSNYASQDAFMKALFEKGGWQDPVYYFNLRSNIYQNPERKFKFFNAHEILAQEIKPESDDQEYPLRLFLFDLPFTASDNGANMPFFQEIVGARSGFAWITWVEINPKTASRMKLANRDLVWVESPHGKIKAVVKVFPGIMPDMAALPLGKEEDFPRPKAASHPLNLLGEGFDQQTGALSRMGMRVKVYKSGGRIT